jgi:hypothetical protein
MLFESASAELVAAYVVALTAMVFCGLVALTIVRGLDRVTRQGL